MKNLVLTLADYNIIAKELGIQGNCVEDSIRMKDVVQNPSMYLNLIERRRMLSEGKKNKGDMDESI